MGYISHLKDIGAQIFRIDELVIIEIIVPNLGTINAHEGDVIYLCAYGNKDNMSNLSACVYATFTTFK